MTPNANSQSSWIDYLDALKPVGSRILATTSFPDDPQSQQETWRTMMETLAQGVVAHVYADPDNPSFISMFNPALNLFAPNPDDNYLWTPIRDSVAYRIRGNRGSVRYVELSFLGGFYPMNGIKAPNLGDLDLDDLDLTQEGDFDVLLSPARPADYAGDWVQLPKGTTNILLRSRSYDWARERDVRIGIECLDGPVAMPRLSAEELSRRLSDLSTWVELGMRTPLDRIAAMREKGFINDGLAPRVNTDRGGPIGQVMLEGLYELDDDEALIIETDIPAVSRYWGFLVTSSLFTTIDWVNRQSSLNASQARLDTDGKFRAVVSSRDPGVPNWLDNGGHSFGGLQGRWNKCDSTPVPRGRKVPFADIRKYLPADTPTVSPQERAEILRARRLAAQLRRNW